MNTEIEHIAKERQKKIDFLKEVIKGKIRLKHLRKPTVAFWMKDQGMYILEIDVNKTLNMPIGTTLTRQEFDELEEKINYRDQIDMFWIFIPPDEQQREKNELEQQQRTQREN